MGPRSALILFGGFRVFCVFFRLAVVVFIHVNFVAAGFSFLFVLSQREGRESLASPGISV